MRQVHLYSPSDDGSTHLARLTLSFGGAPDLSKVTVVLPDMALAPALRASLMQAGAQDGVATLVPPRITTLTLLAGAVELGEATVPAPRRLAELHRLLAARGWFGGAPGWETCRAILGLADELSAALPEPPAESDFVAMIERHYRDGGARVAAPEARLVHEVWRAYARGAPGAALDPGLARRMREREAAARVGGPLILLASRPGGVLTPDEERFASACARRTEVTVTGPDALPDVLAAAWSRVSGMSITERARGLAEGDLASADHVRVLSAPTLEAEARAAVVTVGGWLAAGRRAIAIVAADRVVARRVRALLERDDVLVADEAGWKLSTTSAATCAMRWVDAAIGGFHQRDLTDWLRSPFVFTDMGRDVRQAALASLEHAIRRHQVVGGVAPMRHALALEAPADREAARMVERIEAAARPWARRSAPPDEWFDLLLVTLDSLGTRESLVMDAAGKRVLELARDLREQLGGSASLSLAAWRDFFAAELEAASFRDSAIDSPVVMTSLLRARMRRFECVLLLGAGQAHLGTEVEPGPLLAARLRAQLGLATPEEREAELRDTLGMLIAQCGEFRATWRSGRAHEPLPLAQHFVRLDALVVAAGRPSIIETVAEQAVVPGPLHPALAPAPSAGVLAPSAVSVSAYASLVVCPYQFFARHLLGLNEDDEVREEFEKSDYGQWVHGLLNKLHRRIARFDAAPRAEIAAAMRQLTDEAFAAPIAFNFLSLGWKERWLALIDAYISWQIEREADGWLWRDGEVRAETNFALEDGRALRLHGRLDRIDVRAAGAGVAILDYKTQAPAALKKRVEEIGEDVQLLAYRLLRPDLEAASAAYISVDCDKVVAVPANPDHTLEDERTRLLRVFGALAAGAPLPANAIESQCAWCEMRGLCRRGHWAEGEARDA